MRFTIELKRDCVSRFFALRNGLSNRKNGISTNAQRFPFVLCLNVLYMTDAELPRQNQCASVWIRKECDIAVIALIF